MTMKVTMKTRAWPAQYQIRDSEGNVLEGHDQIRVEPNSERVVSLEEGQGLAVREVKPDDVEKSDLAKTDQAALTDAKDNAADVAPTAGDKDVSDPGEDTEPTGRVKGKTRFGREGDK